MQKYNIPGVKTFEYTKIVGIDNINFGENIIIDDFAFIYSSSPMMFGNYVHIASLASLIGGADLIIGDFSTVSHGVRILTGTDDFNDFGFGNSTIPDEYRNVTRKPINIGRFCIIGANSVVLPDVNIGEGAMVGANPVVTRDLKSWGIYIGNKQIRKRNQADVFENYNQFVKILGK